MGGETLYAAKRLMTNFLKLFLRLGLPRSNLLPASIHLPLLPGLDPSVGKIRGKTGVHGAGKGGDGCWRGSRERWAEGAEGDGRGDGDEGARGKRVRRCALRRGAGTKRRDGGAKEASRAAGWARQKGAAQPGDGTGRKGRPRGRCSQRMVWKEALGRRSKLSPSCSGCSSLSSNEFAEPFMAPLPARPVPSLSSVRCRPASSRKFLTFPSGKPLRGWRRVRRGEAGARGRAGAAAPGRVPGEVGAQRSPPSVGQSRAGQRRRCFPLLPCRGIQAPATLGQEVLEGSRFRVGGPGDHTAVLHVCGLNSG